MRIAFRFSFALPARIALGGFGLWVLSIGARGLLKGHPFAANEPVGKWLLGGVIVHDALIAPVVFVLCAVTYRVAGVRVRQALAAILLIGGSAVIVGLPDVLRKGHNSNPTVTPLDYTGDLVIVLSAVVGGVLLVTVAGAVRGRRRGGPQPTEPGAVRPHPPRVRSDGDVHEEDGHRGATGREAGRERGEGHGAGARAGQQQRGGDLGRGEE